MFSLASVCAPGLLTSTCSLASVCAPGSSTSTFSLASVCAPGSFQHYKGNAGQGYHESGHWHHPAHCSFQHYQGNAGQGYHKPGHWHPAHCSDKHYQGNAGHYHETGHHPAHCYVQTQDLVEPCHYCHHYQHDLQFPLFGNLVLLVKKGSSWHASKCGGKSMVSLDILCLTMSLKFKSSK